MPQTQPVIQSSLGVNAPDLQQFIAYIKERTALERDRLGWGPNRAFTADSLFARFAQVEAQAEQDFRDRASGSGLFADSNLSQNLPFTVASQTHDQMVKDLLETPKFFGINPEGEEDADIQRLVMASMPPMPSPGLLEPAPVEKPTDTLLRVLHRQSRERKLPDVMASALWSTLIQGNQIIRPSYERRVIPKRVALPAFTVAGEPIKDSRGQIVLADEQWQKDPNQDPATADLFLQRDPATRISSTVLIEKSAMLYPTTRMVTTSNGCMVRKVYWADFVMPLTDTWEDSDFRGHFFQSSIDDIMSLMDRRTWSKAGTAYWDEHQRGVLGDTTLVGGQVSAREPIERRREMQSSTGDQNAQLDPRARRKRTFFEWWGRYDFDRDGYAEQVYLLLDWEDDTAIQLESADVVLPWMDAENPHPYHNMRVMPVAERWTGKGYYDLYEPWHVFGDEAWNRARLEMENSGNTFFRDRGAFANPADADNLGFRNGIVNDLMSNVPAGQAFQVVTAPCQADVYMDAADRMAQRIQAHGNTVGAADAGTSALPAADTLGGLELLEQQKNVFINAREREVIPTLNDVVRVFSDIVVYGVKLDPSQMVKQVGDQAAQSLLMFLQGRPGHVRDLLEVSLSKAFGGGQVEVSKNIIVVLKEWMAIPPLWKPYFKPAFERALRGLGDPDPKSALQDPETALAKMQAMNQNAGAPATPGAAPQAEQPKEEPAAA